MTRHFFEAASIRPKTRMRVVMVPQIQWHMEPPRIRRDGPLWRCDGSRAVGLGSTPSRAYQRWLIERMRLVEFFDFGGSLGKKKRPMTASESYQAYKRRRLAEAS